MRLYLFILGVFLFFSCKHFNRNESHKKIPESSIEAGELLAKKYCQSCHAFPEPSLLDVKSWERGVLPVMGPRLGIFQFNWDKYPSMIRDRHLPPGFYPSQPLLTDEEWQHILNFYTATAPDSLPGQQRPFPIRNDLALFSVSAPAVIHEKPMTCFLQLDTTESPHSILISDVLYKSLTRYDRNLKPVDSISTSGPIIDIDFHVRPFVATNIGQLNPTNDRLGKLENVLNENGKMQLDTAVQIDSLKRPVYSVQVDLNADGLPDELICEFGNLTGDLSWYENLGTNKYQRHVLRSLPGAIKAYIRDYNRDGLPDLIVLFAQGEEGIFLFTNRGHGQFDEKEIIRFPPSYGSSSFELDDFNQDGYPDILYTCGDNADYSVVFKPYHGVYIYVNDGHWNYNRKYFFPINGCYKAMARDFDGDGDLDIATIAFFADYQNQPEEGFVYLQNEGDFIFKPQTMNQTQEGRWLTMDVGDLDGDGKPDILLGNFSIAPAFISSKVTWEKNPSFIFLKNISRKP